VKPPPPVHRGGSGEPLVLLHGGGGTWRLWRLAIPLLEEQHDVLAPTLAGHWGGPPIGGDPTPQRLADHVERVMDAAGLDTAHIAAGSLGAWVALELAGRGRARSVVAVAPAGGWAQGSWNWRRVKWLYRLLSLGAQSIAPRATDWVRRPRLRRILFGHHLARAERLSPRDCADIIHSVGNCAALDGLLDWGDAHSGASRLERIRCPVLLAFPEKDRVLPRKRYAQRLTDQLGSAEVVDLPAVGHLAMLDDPKLVAGTIARFARRARTA
jgi:pimeloyl-ACP methyl ester carboxylesterase